MGIWNRRADRWRSLTWASVRDDGGVQAGGHHVPVRQSVVLDCTRGEAFQTGEKEKNDDYAW